MDMDVALNFYFYADAFFITEDDLPDPGEGGWQPMPM
jgi:hypothetical protein